MRARFVSVVLVVLVPLALGHCGRKRQKGPSFVVDRVVAAGSAACSVMRDGTLRCWGDAVGTTGKGVPEPIDPGPGVKAACVGPEYACLVAEGAVRCVRTGDGGAAVRITGVGAAKDVSCERTRTCAIEESGRVACWTLGSDAARAIDGLEGAVSIASGAGVTCAVLGDGSVRCFGENRDGQLGDGTTEPRQGLVTVKIDHAERVVIGGRHACAKRADETVWCWGRNEHGQLGDDSRTDRPSPGPVAGAFGVDGIATGDAHTCARMKDSTIRCWGSGSHHQAGRSTTTEDALAPTLVPGLYEATAVAAGDAFSCARMKDGWLRCWGANDVGQLGEGTDLERAVPVPIRYP
jgi:hypothetical protein